MKQQSDPFPKPGNKLSKLRRFYFNASSKLFILAFVLFVLPFSGCEKEDVGKCTIKISGGNKVIDDISLEECQLEFGETVGATGWSWEPNN